METELQTAGLQTEQSAQLQSVLQQFREKILSASEQKSALSIQGGMSKDWFGQRTQRCNHTILNTRDYRGIIDYEPSELVITSRCGTPLSEIEALLDEQGQMLAFEPPHFSSEASFGGMFCAGLSGPRRAYAGALRDFVLGASLMDSQGQILQFGGRVMKNVAGYDVSRLLAGSMGCLGLVLDISLKVLPKPQDECTLIFAMSEPDALKFSHQASGQGWPVSASVWHAGYLMLRLSGSESALAIARRHLGGECFETAQNFWESVREQTHPFFTFQDEYTLWRCSLPANTPALKLRGHTLIEWGGAQRWLYTDQPEEVIRQAVAQLGGYLTRFKQTNSEDGGAEDLPVFAAMAPSLEKIHQNLLQKFDPAGIFNPGRMYPKYPANHT